LLRLLATAEADGIDMSGDPAVLGRLMSLIDNPDPDFAIVTP
jgi:alkyl sulfatase BDS1-like metallo-beta-lactamase superfamily hydrolase